jgi:TolB protein
MRFSRVVPYVLSAAVLLAVSGAADARDVYLNIEKGFGEKITVALPLFEGAGGMVDASNIRDVLMFDLSNSGHFSVVENLEFVDETEAADRATGSVAFPEWIALGGEILVKGAFEAGLSEFSLEAMVYDLGQGKAILGRKYAGEAGRWRDVVHSLSNDIVALIAGEQGIALTKIAFVSNVTGTKQIYVMDYDGENRRRITRDDLLAIYPDWFPDGKRLAYTRYRNQRQEACIGVTARRRPCHVAVPGREHGDIQAPGRRRQPQEADVWQKYGVVSLLVAGRSPNRVRVRSFRFPSDLRHELDRRDGRTADLQGGL